MQDILANIPGHVGPPVVLRNKLQGFEATSMPSYPCVVAERDYSAAKVRGLRDIDSAMVVQQAFSFRPLLRSKGAGGRLLQFSGSPGNRFLLGVLDSLADISQNVALWSDKLQTLQCTYREEFWGKEHDI